MIADLPTPHKRLWGNLLSNMGKTEQTWGKVRKFSKTVLAHK